MLSFFGFFVVLLSVLPIPSTHGRVFSFKMHHRFSEPVKRWAQTAGNFSNDETWPEKGSVQYYSELANHDLLRRGRRLSESDAPLSFADGNSTFRISSLGFLHYTTIQLGTPGVKFLVALDTGSDLFWVPCDCTRCAPTEGTAYASDFELSIYSPEKSSTSRTVTCDNSLCSHRNRCIGSFSSCPYIVSYVSAETSTSGILVEDVLHLVKEDNQKERIQPYITFGCGQVQSGSFLDVAAPNGLFGLGMEKISVPSILSRQGIMENSFSLCFGNDGLGRITFGDKGSPDQEETPFNLNPLRPSYNITVTQIRVGTTLFDVDFTALFDTGTSFTYLVDPFYTKLSHAFNSQIKDKRNPPNSRIPFEYCYSMSPEANTSLVPRMSLTFRSRSHFAVYDPIIVISNQGELIYCLAIVKSAELNIIGQNFMTGHRLVFDREKLVLGWKKFNCYDMEEDDPLARKPWASSVPPAVAAKLGNHSDGQTVGNGKVRTKNAASTLLWKRERCVHIWIRSLIALLLYLNSF